MKRKSIPANVRKRIYEKYRGRCAYCGNPIEYKEMQIDHMEPLAKGGADSEENYMPACRTCNHYKSTLTVEQFREQIGLLTKRLVDRVYIYKLAQRHGRIAEINSPITFYFEKKE